MIQFMKATLTIILALVGVSILGCRRDSPAQETADIYYDFPSVPADQVLDIYANLCAKKADFDRSQWDGRSTITLRTEHRVTKTEAKRLLENALKVQCHLTFVFDGDSVYLQSESGPSPKKKSIRIHSRPATGMPPSRTPETANIYYNFPAMPALSVLDIYGQLSGKKVNYDPSLPLNKPLHIVTARKVTPTEAKHIIEQAFEEQLRIRIIHTPDGTPMLVPLH